MIDDPNSPPAPPPTTAPAEQPLSDSVATPQLNTKEIEPSKDSVVLIGGATSWPSLFESTRPSPRPSSTDPPIAASQASALSNSSQNHGRPTPKPNPSFPTNPNRQRSSGRGGSGRGGVSRGGFIRHTVPPQQLPSLPPLPPAFLGGFQDPNRGPFFYGNGFGAYPRPTDHQLPQSSSSHWGGGRPRGYGIRHYNHSNYRAPDWNTAPQGFHPRDVRFPHTDTQMAYPVPPQPMVPFTYMHGPVLSAELFMGMPLYTGGHVPVPPPRPVDLQTKLLNQINYYFSEENLIKDTYLRSKMDDGGWVPVDLIANFKKVRDLTQDIQLVRESLGASAVVEVQGDTMRRRIDWRRWIPTSSVTEVPISGLNTIIRYFQNATLEEVHADQNSSSATNASSSAREVPT